MPSFLLLLNASSDRVLPDMENEGMESETQGAQPEIERPSWLYPFEVCCEYYVIPILCGIGILFNTTSVSVLFSSTLHLKKSLVVLFSFLNISDCVFLVCTFLIFGLPNHSLSYSVNHAPYAVPYVLPLLQTFLTISVYATMAIAIIGALEVKTSMPDQEAGLVKRIIDWFESRHINGTAFGIIAVCVFSVVFNLSRWFEMETIVEYDEERNVTVPALKNTDLRSDQAYVKWYGLTSSCIIMVLIPALVLIWSCFVLSNAMPEGTQRKKILRIMVIIITMFFTCHVPKVVLTAYEIATYGSDKGPVATWAIVLKEVSHILLVCYSAFNPLAYCGDLMCRFIWAKICCCWTARNSVNNIHSEAVQMKSVNIISKDLDAQSKLLSMSADPGSAPMVV